MLGFPETVFQARRQARNDPGTTGFYCFACLSMTSRADVLDALDALTSHRCICTFAQSRWKTTLSFFHTRSAFRRQHCNSLPIVLLRGDRTLI